MRRQLQANGGIMNARQGYGIGSFVKEKLRKLIPNELADIAVKAAPFVAPFQPGIAAAMRGIGRFDQRGSVSDALKQAGGTYAFGKGARYLGGATGKTGGLDSYTMEGFKKGPVGNMFSGGESKLKDVTELKVDPNITPKDPGIIERTTNKLFSKVPFADKISQTVKEQLAVGGVTSAATYLYEKFIADYPEPVPGEDMTAYLAERKQRVGTQMRTYMDNYLAYDPQYSAMSDAEKNAFVERNNKNMGGLMRTGIALVKVPRHHRQLVLQSFDLTALSGCSGAGTQPDQRLVGIIQAETTPVPSHRRITDRVQQSVYQMVVDRTLSRSRRLGSHLKADLQVARQVLGTVWVQAVPDDFLQIPATATRLASGCIEGTVIHPSNDNDY